MHSDEVNQVQVVVAVKQEPDTASQASSDDNFGRINSPEPTQLRLSDIPLWNTSPISGLSRPQPILPDTQEDQVFSIDKGTVANLWSFQRQVEDGRSPTTGDVNLSPSSPPTLYNEERRNTWAPSHFTTSPTLDSTCSPSPSACQNENFPRRRSAPTVTYRSRYSQRLAQNPERGAHIVAPRRLRKPDHPARLPHGLDIWWPMRSDGQVLVQVTIESGTGAVEKLTRCFLPEQLPMVFPQTQPRTPGTPALGAPIPFPAPGTVLPVPGTRPVSTLPDLASRGHPSAVRERCDGLPPSDYTICEFPLVLCHDSSIC